MMEGGQQRGGWVMTVESIMSISCRNHLKIIFTAMVCSESHDRAFFFVYVGQCISYSANAWWESWDMNIWVLISKQFAGLYKREIEGEGETQMNRTHYHTIYSYCFTHFHIITNVKHCHEMLPIWRSGNSCQFALFLREYYNYFSGSLEANEEKKKPLHLPFNYLNCVVFCSEINTASSIPVMIL